MRILYLSDAAQSTVQYRTDYLASKGQDVYVLSSYDSIIPRVISLDIVRLRLALAEGLLTEPISPRSGDLRRSKGRR